MSSTRPLQLVVIVGHDAYMKGARNILKMIPRHFRTQWFTTSAQLVSEQVRLFEVSCAGTHSSLLRADVVLAGLGGKELNTLIHALRSKCLERAPRIISYFPGILHYRIFEALITRVRCDLVLLNCKRDHKLYRKLAKATIGYDNGVLYGSPWLSLPSAKTQILDIDLLFVEQSIVPSGLESRTSLVQRLYQLAVDNPNMQIVVALRARKGEASSHSPEFCLEEIYSRTFPVLPNILFSCEGVDGLVSRSCRVATISSSVGYKSLVMGVPTLFIDSFGVRKDFGNDLFVGSGCMGPLEVAGWPSIDSGWFEEMVKVPDSIPSSFFNDNSECRSWGGDCFLNTWQIARLLMVFMISCLSANIHFSELPRLVKVIKNINKKIYSPGRIGL